MSQHQSFRRMPVPQQVAQQLQTVTLPAPTRGLIMSENDASMAPGGALVLDNWRPTMKGIGLRGGCGLWCQLPEHTPVISAFEYVSSNVQRMFAANATKVYDVTSAIPVQVASGRTSGNYAASQMANQGGDWLIAVNDAGNPPLRFDGTTWTTITTEITNIPAAGLCYVCKYRNRLFFIEVGSMNAWYLPLNAVGGALALIPLSGAATKGGKLLFCASWSIDAGDGIDDKLVFATTEGELLIFTGSDPSVSTNWRQEGRYEVSPPLGMNAHLLIGGELMIATVDGIVPTSGAISKSRTELELAAITRNVKPMWREEVLDKREYHWTMCRWDEYGGLFTTFPGGTPGKYRCLVTNLATTAHARYTGWDAMCFMRMRGGMYFGTQTGRIMQADRGGYDDGAPYVATMVGGWEMFNSPSQTVTWRQSRCNFKARAREPFIPQISATTDYAIVIPPPPPVGIDPGPLDLWDEGLWDTAKWDAPSQPSLTVQNTGWVSVGATGYSHAPVLQVTVGQVSKPDVEMISISATFEREGVNV